MPMADARFDLSVKYVTFFHFNQSSLRIKKKNVLYDVQIYKPGENCPMSKYRHQFKISLRMRAA